MTKPKDALIYLDGAYRKIGEKGKVYYWDGMWQLSGMTPQYLKHEMKRAKEEEVSLLKTLDDRATTRRNRREHAKG